MSSPPVAIVSTGLVASVGLTVATACAAMRAKLSNPTETRLKDSAGTRIVAHQVPVHQGWRGRRKLVGMAAAAVHECVLSAADWTRQPLPLLLCVAERERPGRIDGLDDLLLTELATKLGNVVDISASRTIPFGRVGVLYALEVGREMFNKGSAPAAIIVAADSLLVGPTLSVIDREGRLLGLSNSNGFIPGEAAGALLVAPLSKTSEARLACLGLGQGREPATVLGNKPLRGDGLANALKAAAIDASCGLHQTDYRITDLSGEHFYFKEAALALSRSMRQRKEEYDIWHPAESIGECGSAIGAAMVCQARHAVEKGYAKGPTVLLHAGTDQGARMAAIFRDTRGF